MLVIEKKKRSWLFYFLNNPWIVENYRGGEGYLKNNVLLLLLLLLLLLNNIIIELC